MQSKQKDKEFYFDNAVCGSTFKENVKKKGTGDMEFGAGVKVVGPEMSNEVN